MNTVIINHGSSRLWSILLPLVTGAPLSKDFVTFRYYGRYADRFKRTANYPGNPSEVCSEFKAVCIDIRLNECVQAAPEMRAVYTQEVVDRSAVRMFAIPQENSFPRYMMVQRNQSKFKLWSGCDQGCFKCSQGTGLALNLPSVCASTQQGSVFGVYWNPNDGTRNTNVNCVGSLQGYWSGVQRDVEFKNKVFLIMSGTTFVLLGLCVCCLCVRCRIKKRRAERRFALAVQEGREQSSMHGVIGQSQIERQFPVTKIQGQPQCVVCLVIISETDDARKLHCGHVFHSDCILAWWLHKPRSAIECPVCKRLQCVDGEEKTATGNAIHSSAVTSLPNRSQFTAPPQLWIDGSTIPDD